MAKSASQVPRPTFAPPTTPAALADLVAALGCPLPSCVRDLFAEHDSISAPDIHNGYFIGDSLVLTRSLRRGDFPDTNGSTPILAFGSDGGGNAFMMPRRRDGTVWKWRHNIGDFVVLADSFAAFLNRLADDFYACAAGKLEWDFMAG